MVNLKRKKPKQNKTKTILKCLTTKSRGFNQDFKNENLCFSNLYSVHTARILDLSL